MRALAGGAAATGVDLPNSAGGEVPATPAAARRHRDKAQQAAFWDLAIPGLTGAKLPRLWHHKLGLQAGYDPPGVTRSPFPLTCRFCSGWEPSLSSCYRPRCKRGITNVRNLANRNVKEANAHPQQFPSSDTSCDYSIFGHPNQPELLFATLSIYLNLSEPKNPFCKHQTIFAAVAHRGWNDCSLLAQQAVFGNH